MRPLKSHFPAHALTTLDTMLKQTKEARVFRRAQAVREVVAGHHIHAVSAAFHVANSALRRPNRCFTVDQLLGSECHRRLFDARWPCIFNDQGLIWNHAWRSIVFFINPFHTDSCLII